MKLALVVIARNEAARLPRLLRSVAPWVDHMLVMDTGSSDSTIAVARAHSAEVRSFRWCDDFAAARNAALDAAGATWHLVLDADEWLLEGGERLRDLRHLQPAFVAQLALEEVQPDGDQPSARSWLSRILPGAVRYAGRIHEQPVHRLPVRQWPIRIGHDGYGSEALRVKRGRNRALLQRALADAPHDAYLWYQLGKNAQVYEQDEQAEAAFERAQALTTDSESWWADLVTRRLYGLKRLRRHAAGLALAESTALWESPCPDLAFALGDLLLDWAASCPADAKQLLAAAESAWRHCLELGERPDLPSTVPGRGGHLAAHNLSLVLQATGRTDAAAELRHHHGLGASPLRI